MRTTLIALLMLSWLPSAAAQNSNPQVIATSQRPRPLPPPVLMVEVNDRATPLRLAEVDAQVTIIGHLAETSLTMRFYNPNQRAMEGDLYFPLPEGATISKYALDVQGKLVDGVVVAKNKARQVFEAEVRKGIDPGLVEWTQGNNFKTRIFPIPARGSRTVRVAYVSEVVESKGRATYHLPLNFRDRVESFSLRLEVVKATAKPLVIEGGPRGLRFDSARESYIAETRLRNTTLTRDLIVALPDLARRPVAVERAPDGETYFAIHHVLGSQQTAATGASRATPRRIGLYWDATLSRGQDPQANHDAELAVLERYLASLGNARVAVDLVLLRNQAERARRYQMPQQRAALLAALRGVEYDGGSQLADIGSLPGTDLDLVFSDGISNFGEQKPRRLDAPTYVINGATTANHAFLRYLAMRSGGAYFNLQRVSAADAIAGIGKQSFTFIKAEAQGARLDSLYPQLRVPVHGVFDLAGKLTAAQASITLHYGVGNQVTQRQTFTVRRSDAVSGDIVQRYWAQKKVDDLMVFAKENAEAIVDVGRQYSIVTPGTSLLVLERLDQYVEHEVRPPASLPAMRAEYDQTMKQRVLIARNVEAEKLEKVLGWWNEHKEWWSKRYQYPKNFRIRPESSKSGEAPGGVRGGVAGGRADGRSVRDAFDDDDDDADGEAEEAPREMERASRTRAAPAAKSKKKDSDGSPSEPEPSVVLKPWTPDTPYLKAIARAPVTRRFAVYLEQRKSYGQSPAFFLDVADFFRERKDKVLALQVLSNLAELELENPALLRVLAHRLGQLGYLGLSAQVFERVLELRPEEPQSYRDLALILARRGDQGQGTQKRADYERAMDLLGKVVMGQWDRFDRIEVIALTELNNIWPRARRLGVSKPPVDSRLIAPLDMDVRIVMTWDADLTDMDLHVIEPSGEEAYYSHNRTTIGGMVSRDFTQGYGPEVYAVRRAMRGTYEVKTKFFGSSAAQLIGAVTLQVDIFTNYGRPNQKVQSITLRLTERKEEFTVGSIRF